MCDTTSTLIDNSYTNSADKNCTSGILIRPFSDHQMYFCMINSNFCYSDQAKKLIEVEVCDHESIQRFITEVSNDNIYNKFQKNLNTNTNYNYEILLKHLLNAKLKHIPKKVKKFNKRRHLREKWMTNEILQEIVHPIPVVCIQVSWGHEEIDIRYFSLPNYTLINANRRLSLHGGLILIFMMILHSKS